MVGNKIIFECARMYNFLLILNEPAGNDRELLNYII